jgi:hypothetical protein
MKTRAFIFWIVTAIAAATVLRADIDVSILLTDSPFVPENWSPNGKGAVDASQQYIFKGVYSIGEDTFIDINDSRSDKSSWIKIGETKNGVKAVSYDSIARKATILASGRELTLEIPKPKGNVAPVGAAVNSLARNKNGPPVNVTSHKASRERRMLPPPPWANKNSASGSNSKSNRTAKNTKSSSSTTSTSSDTSSTTSTSSSTTPDNNETVTPTPETDPVTTTPANPPTYVPTIPDNIRELIESGAAPSKD